MQELNLQDSIGLLIAAARRRIKQVVWSRLLPYGLTPQQFWVLLVLREHEGMSLHQLAEQIWTDDPTACRIIAKLADRKLVRADSHPDDRRRFRLRLTARGRKLAVDLVALAEELRTGIERGLSAADRDTLRELLGRVVANTDRMGAGSRPERRGSAGAHPRRARGGAV